LLNTRDTVFALTFATAATSRMVLIRWSSCRTARG
jgi:hypothetical protein